MHRLTGCEQPCRCSDWTGGHGRQAQQRGTTATLQRQASRAWVAGLRTSIQSLVFDSTNWPSISSLTDACSREGRGDQAVSSMALAAPAAALERDGATHPRIARQPSRSQPQRPSRQRALQKAHRAPLAAADATGHLGRGIAIRGWPDRAAVQRDTTAIRS